MLDKIEQAVRIHQSNEKIITAARLVARLLERVILGYSIADTMNWALKNESFSKEELEYILEVCGMSKSILKIKPFLSFIFPL